MTNRFDLSSLSILLWNANGVLQHLNELEYVLHEKRVDIALISETHLTSRSKFYLKGYSIYRSDRPDNRGYGGAAVIIRSSIQHFFYPTCDPTESIQAAAVAVKLSNVTFTVAAIYCPPRFALKTPDFSEFFSSLGTHFLCGGDYNAKHVQWGSRLNNPRGRALLQSILSNHLQIHSTGSPTYWPSAISKQPDLLDFFVSRGMSSFYSSILSLDDLSSDHSAVLFDLSCTPLEKLPAPSLTSNTVDWDLFRHLLQTNLRLDLPLKTPADIDAAVEHLTTSIQQAAWGSNLPTRRKKKDGPNYPNFIRELIRDKRRA